MRFSKALNLDIVYSHFDILCIPSHRKQQSITERRIQKNLIYFFSNININYLCVSHESLHEDKYLKTGYRFHTIMCTIFLECPSKITEPTFCSKVN